MRIRLGIYQSHAGKLWSQLFSVYVNISVCLWDLIDLARDLRGYNEVISWDYKWTKCHSLDWMEPIVPSAGVFLSDSLLVLEELHLFHHHLLVFVSLCVINQQLRTDAFLLLLQFCFLDNPVFCCPASEKCNSYTLRFAASENSSSVFPRGPNRGRPCLHGLSCVFQICFMITYFTKKDFLRWLRA